MNFYKRYPADYGKKTARLTLAQHGAYTLLLDELYSTELPLPAEIDELYRVCRAMNKAEQEAVRFVADRFFPIGADGLRHNKRGTEELIEAAPAVAAARANGAKGGRPRKETKQKPSGLSGETETETQSEPNSKPPHSSDTSTTANAVAEARASRLPKPFSLPDEWAIWASEKRPDLSPQEVAEKFADYWHGRAGKDGRKLDWFATWRNWVRDERAPIAAAQTFKERDTANAIERVRQTGGGLVHAKPVPITRRNDALQEVFDATPRLVG